jgi:hypothetical protein
VLGGLPQYALKNVESGLGIAVVQRVFGEVEGLFVFGIVVVDLAGHG